MIESKLSPWVGYKIIGYMIALDLVCIPFYATVGPHNETIIEWKDFLWTTGLVILLGILIFLISLASKHRIIINEPKVKIGRYLWPYFEEVPVTDIKGMSWQNLNRSFRSLRGLTTSINEQSFCIVFKSRELLEISKADYDNYHEMANWFFKYCKKNEIIKIDPLEVRKRSRTKRQEIAKKL